MTDAKDNAAPRCPRCGYDLSGSVATWKESCPLEGVCSECGLLVLWRDALRPDFQRLAWLYEHAPSPLAPSRAARTFLRAIGPWTFWRSLKMTHSIAPARLWLFLAAVLACAHLLLAAPPAIGEVWYTWAWTWADVRDVAIDALRPFPYESGMPTAAVLALVLLFPWLLLLLPFTLRRCRVRRAHLLRLMVYSSLGVLPIAAHAGAALCVQELWSFTGSPTMGALLARLQGWVGWTLLACAAWTVFAWYCGVRRYLRLPHALAVTLLVAFLDFLLVLVAFISFAEAFGL